MSEATARKVQRFRSWFVVGLVALLAAAFSAAPAVAQPAERPDQGRGHGPVEANGSACEAFDERVPDHARAHERSAMAQECSEEAETPPVGPPSEKTPPGAPEEPPPSEGEPPANGDDFAGPELVEATVTPETVEPGDTVEIDWHVTDESGVAYTDINIQHAETGVWGPYSEQCYLYGEEPYQGDKRDGRYTATCTLPSNLNSGIYELWTSSSDELGNSSWQHVGQIEVV